MKCTLVLALAFFAAVYCEETYTTENDDLNIEAVINDDKQLNAFLNCFMDEGPCDKVTAHFRKDMPEAIQQACAKCTPAQKYLLKRFLEGLRDKRLKGLEAMKAKYDPENKYFGPLQAAINYA